MSLNEYQRSQGAWAIICLAFIDPFLDYEYTMCWLIISMYSDIPKTLPTFHHSAWLPIEWVPYVIIVWLTGCMIIWAVNKFR